MLEGAELQSLADDIEQHGLQEPIMLFEGKILDGRNRYRACVMAGVDPQYVDWQGGNPLAFVISHNLHRRHLTTSQRAMVAAKLAKDYDPTVNLQRGLGKPQKSTDCPIFDNRGKPTQNEAAEMMKVSRSLVSDARQVLAADQQVADAVTAGNITVSKARGMVTPTRKQKEQKTRNKDNPDSTRNKTKRRNAARYAQLRDGLEAIAGLPDIDSILRAIPVAGRERITRALPHAVRWLNEFHERWSEVHEPGR